MRKFLSLFSSNSPPVICTQVETTLPEPYASVKLLPFDPHGWYKNRRQIEQVFKIKKPKVIIEIGSWLGASTRHMASLLPQGGVVYAVDHWLGSVEHQVGKIFWHPALPQLYEQFLSNVIHAGLTDKIIPVRMSSLDASQHLKNITPDLIYIDAGHDFESVYADLNGWYPYVKGKGILCGDDWVWRGVRKAVNQFAEENQLRINARGNFWRLIEN